jgi:hypothetical protein
VSARAVGAGRRGWWVSPRVSAATGPMADLARHDHPGQLTPHRAATHPPTPPAASSTTSPNWSLIRHNSVLMRATISLVVAAGKVHRRVHASLIPAAPVREASTL